MMRLLDFRRDLLPLKDKLYRLALRITLNPADAEDITADVLAGAWQRRAELGLKDSPEAFCLASCRNRAIDLLRHREQQNVSLDEARHDAPASEDTAQQRMEREQQLRLVRRLVDSLPEKQRTVMQLRDVEGMRYAEIAEATGLTEADVKVTLHRARAQVREQYMKIDNYGL